MSRLPARVSTMDLPALRSACTGAVAIPGDAAFPELLLGGLWNRLIPERVPQVLVRAADESDVATAIRFAREHGLKVVVRGGGHNWCQPTLRHGGLLIDLTDLNQVLSIDAEARRAVVQPIVSNRDVQRLLNARGLAFPSGHCPEVKLSGYLLGGGMAWNQGIWGPGIESVEAIELVTAAGEHIMASATENADYFWAARGAGCGFFGVATRYHLRLYPLPPAIHGSSYWFPLEDAVAVAQWLGELAPKLAPFIELTLFFLDAPPELRDRGAKACLVTAAAFAETAAEVEASLRLLEDAPVPCLAREFATPTTFEQLFDASGALWPEGLRNRVEAMFYDTPLHELARAAQAQIAASPSPLTLVLFTIFTGARRPLSDAAFSMNAAVYGGPWTMWREPAGDVANIAWHDACVRDLAPLACGHYIGESDVVHQPSHAARTVTPQHWQRLAELRARLDPDGLFFSHAEGLAP